MKYYMHTLNGRPAFYFEDEQICYAGHGRGAVALNVLAKSLKQIKREQKASKAWREEEGLFDGDKMGYVVVYLPQEAEQEGGE